MGSLVVTSVDRARVKSVLPKWFKTETGFRFLYGGDEAVVIGFGGWREVLTMGNITLSQTSEHKLISETLFTLKFNPVTLVISYNYKGEWHMGSVESIIHESEKDGQEFPFSEMTDAD